MRVRVPLLAAVTAALAASAVPASAAVYPACAARLAEAATGDSGTCYAQGPGPIEIRDGGLYRTVTVEVASGAVDATLTCGTYTNGLRVSGFQPVSFGQWTNGELCITKLVAVVDHTTAVATSVASYVFNPS